MAMTTNRKNGATKSLSGEAAGAAAMPLVGPAATCRYICEATKSLSGEAADAAAIYMPLVSPAAAMGSDKVAERRSR
jgi:hypothetical protein